ncbi:MAG: hypothetical protein WDZ93_00905 [Candidatus Paceibacterota bacterium]
MTTTTYTAAILRNRELHTILSCTVLCTLFAAYVYFLSASVVHVVIRKEVNNEVALLNSDISKLESEYIKRQHAVSGEIAARKGFVAVNDKIFLDRSDTTLVLSTTRR